MTRSFAPRSLLSLSLSLGEYPNTPDLRSTRGDDHTTKTHSAEEVPMQFRTRIRFEGFD